LLVLVWPVIVMLMLPVVVLLLLLLLLRGSGSGDGGLDCALFRITLLSQLFHDWKQMVSCALEHQHYISDRAVCAETSAPYKKNTNHSEKQSNA
jgi:hypothetical protein